MNLKSLKAGITMWPLSFLTPRMNWGNSIDHFLHCIDCEALTQRCSLLCLPFKVTEQAKISDVTGLHNNTWKKIEVSFLSADAKQVRLLSLRCWAAVHEGTVRSFHAHISIAPTKNRLTRVRHMAVCGWDTLRCSVPQRAGHRLDV